MNKLIPIVLLFGGLTIFSYSTDKAFTIVSSGNAFTKVSAPMKYKPAITSLSMKETKQKATKKEFSFENVNGISLYDNVKAVTDKLGQPLSKEKDPNFAELEIYAFPKMNIGFSEGIVNYVEVLAAAGTVNIDGISIPIEQESLKNALGEPNFIAEDGIVFQRNAALIKLFKDVETHEVTSLHYYHHSNI